MSTTRVVVLAVTGLLAFLLFKAVAGALSYLLAGALLAAGAYLYYRAKRAVRG